ncbi:MAG: energy transducer TonB [Cytophagales bacterium CG12_big_fil_rev_8_21_14_0_65_40_12]|nr:MAG: energy transducer TonB [Cytophagales bacterium CG12_big_fil_rev_8_21_14_0_65_40_12]PIW05301.1 MAG: energy transducer TonB [Cytophagales bacterium CG17_big_fil_post_rev_8_21_14_2_50_40_13]
MENKKNPKVDFSTKRSLFLLIGLCASISLTLAAFEYKTISKPIIIVPDLDSDELAFYEPPITVIEPPKPPVIAPKIIEIPNDDDVDVEIPPYIFDDFNKYIAEEPVEFTPLPKEDVVEEFIVVEEEAKFPGGAEAWTKFLTKNLKYPKQAQRANIEGRVILNFYVDAEGNISKISVLRGIGSGCDEEAIRVLSKSPKWKPGLQRGVPFKSAKQIAFVFKLN